MIILPAIDIKDGKCVRLRKGEFDTAEQVAASPYDTADSFLKAGATAGRYACRRSTFLTFGDFLC